MSELLVVAVALFLRAAASSTSSGIVIDITQIQWWQGLVATLGILGLSPAPWILGLAVNRIEFTGPAALRHKAALTEQERHYEALLVLERARYAELAESNKANADAAEKHRSRAESVTDAALAMTEVVTANSHVLAELNKVAREATKS